MSRSVIAGAVMSQALRTFTMTALIFIVGCGSGVGSPLTGRSARSKCLDAGFGQDFIDTMFIAVRTDRDSGFSRSTEFSIVLQSVTSCLPGTEPLCVNCFTAIVDEVYR